MGCYREQKHILNKMHSEQRDVPQMLHGMATAIELFGTQGCTVPCGCILLVPFSVRHQDKPQ